MTLAEQWKQEGREKEWQEVMALIEQREQASYEKGLRAAMVITAQREQESFEQGKEASRHEMTQRLLAAGIDPIIVAKVTEQS